MWRPKHLLILAATLAASLFAQNPVVQPNNVQPVQRKIVERADVSVPGREAVIVHVEIAPGASVGRHTHPGEEISYITDGEADLLIEGRPARRVKAGDGFVVPAGAVHDAHNTGSVPLKLVAVYLVEKGKPLSTPVP